MKTSKGHYYTKCYNSRKHFGKAQNTFNGSKFIHYKLEASKLMIIQQVLPLQFSQGGFGGL